MPVVRTAITAIAMFVSHAALSMAPAPDGEAVFQKACAACHAAAVPLESVPNRQALRQFTPDAILNSMVNGKMQPQAAMLSDAEKRLVSEHLTGNRLAADSGAANANLCKDASGAARPSGPTWNGWGNGPANTRFQKGGLTAADLPKLKLKWAFGYENVSAARAQPAIVAGRMFVASENGTVQALDPHTGCNYWTYKAQAGVRAALSVGPYRSSSGVPGSAVYFGDSRASMYAVDAQTGQQIWTRKVDDHAAAGITGAPAVHGGRVYVPVQGVSEEIQGGSASYECCTFRGSVSSLDASTGEVIWKTYTVPEVPRHRARNEKGVQMWGPAGVSIWSSPTVDVKRSLLYVATGNGYADPPLPTSDAIIAMDLATGAMQWTQQMIPGGDNWVFACMQAKAGDPACPKEMGPDFDFSASPIITTVRGRDLLVVPQKSGMVYALDPDKNGALVWEYRFGQGSAMGGQWGGAIDERNFYVGVADLLTPAPGGMRALNLATGKLAWEAPPQPKLCGEAQSCLAGQGAAVTVIPGAVLSVGLDGGVRAYAAKDGKILWQFDTNRPFETINGVKANGGGMDGAGPIVVGRMLYVNSGYGGVIGRPGNVLLAFGIE